MTFAVRAPGRDVQHFVPRGRECGHERAAVAARAFDADDGIGRVVLGEPAQDPPVAVWGVGEQQRAVLAAALIDQRRGVRVLVDVDADEHVGLLARG